MSLKNIVGLVSAVAIGGITIYGMGCSSASSSGNPGQGETDSGTKTDTGVGTAHDTGTTSTGDTGTVAPGDASEGDTGAPPPACFMPTAFTAVMWAAPTALHQGACTTAQLTAYGTSLNAVTMAGQTATSGNATCDACLQTDVGAAAHGPVITMSGSPEEINFGGCIADIDGSKAAGGCGNTVNNENDCIQTECGTCSDIEMMPQPITQACVDAAFASGGPCGATTNEPTMACNTELSGTAEQACLTVSTLFAAWCGPSTSPTDAGAD